MAVEIILLIERGLNQETVFFTLHHNLTSGYFIFIFIRRLCPKNELTAFRLIFRASILQSNMNMNETKLKQLT